MVKALLGTNGYQRNGADPLDCLARASRLGDCAVVAPLEKPFTDGILDALAAAEPDEAPPSTSIRCSARTPRSAARSSDGTVVWKDPDHVTGTFLDEQRDAMWERLTATGLLGELTGLPESPVVGEDRAKSSTREPSMPNRFSVLLAACVTAAPLFLTAAPPAVGRQDGHAPTGHHADALDLRRGLPGGARDGVTVDGGSRRRSTAPSPCRRPPTPTRSGTARRAPTTSAPGPPRSWRSATPSTQAISSWNAVTPTGTWVETSFRGRYPDGTWSKWYVLGRWTSGMDYAAGDIHRTSLNGQGDTDGTVLTDTFASRKKRKPVAFQTRVRLLRPAGTTTSPRLDAVTTMSSAAYPDKHKVDQRVHLGRRSRARRPAVRPEHPLR